MGVIWPSPSLTLVKESEYVARFLKMNDMAEYLIEINQSTVTMEDHVEILSHHFKNNEFYDPVAAQRKIRL
jgi:hypothetical protein